MSQENVEVVRRAYEVYKSLGKTGAELGDIAPERRERPRKKTYGGAPD